MSDFDMNKAASTMFPDMAPAAAPAPAPAAKPAAETDFEKAANTLFGDTVPKPPAPSKLRGEPTDEIEKAEKFFENSPIFENAKREIENAALENLETPEAAAEIAAQYEGWYRDFSLNSTEASQLTELGVSATMNPPSHETLAGWAEASRQALRQEFGPRAGEALQAAQQLVAKNSQLKTFLHETGLGSSPAFVRLAAQKAMDLKKRGKL